MRLLQKTIIGKQAVGEIDTYCKFCQKKRTIKIQDDASFTIKCKCGVEVYRYHDADEFHDKPFYTRNFISYKKFNKKIHEKQTMSEKFGFKEENGKLVK